MKIKIFFLISAMNSLSYLCYGDCCGGCCNCWDCWDNCGEKENGKKNEDEKKDENEKIEEQIFLEEKEDTDEEFKKFVNEDWLEKIKNNKVIFKIYEKKEKKDNGEYIEVIKDAKGKIEVKNFKPEPDTGKWALFEIKTTEKNTVYLYCSDIESGEKKYNTYGIFDGKKNILNISVLACDTNNVTDMSYMFLFCSNLIELKFSDNFKTSKVEKMNGMFSNCSELKNLDLSNFNTSNVTNMSYMFYNCSKLKNLDLPKFDTSKVNKMAYMFYNCNNLKKVTVSNLKTKDKIFKELEGEGEGWEVIKNNDKITLIKVEEKE